MTYEYALLIAAAFYALVTAGATWLCVFIFDPLAPIRRDRKARRYLVIGFALLCFATGYGIANAEIVSGTLQVYYRPAECDPAGELSLCTPAVYEGWMQEAARLRDYFWRWILVPPMTRPTQTMSLVVCNIVRLGSYGNPQVWYFVALARGRVMAATALVVGWLLTRLPKAQYLEEEALLSLRRESCKGSPQRRRRCQCVTCEAICL
ncbi:MAG: hypothetical protein U0694_09535 [Anaerolineae bacterium]